MKQSLRSKLSVSYILITFICMLLVSFTSNFFLERQFRQYVINNLQHNSADIVSEITRQYETHKGWEGVDLQIIGINALENGFILDVKDVNSVDLWNSYSYNNGMCQEMLGHMTQNMLSRYPNWKGKYEYSRYPVVSGGTQVGTVEVGYFGPFYYTDNDLAFLNTLNKILIAVGLLSLIPALLLAHVMAKRLSTPISRVINTAQMIAKGYYEDRSEEKSSINEINQLTAAVNELAETLQNQEKLRKRLSADVAHELRTPLTTLQSHTEAMIDGIWAPDIDRLQSCHEEIMRISRLVGDLEKLARYEGESLVLAKVPFRLDELVKTIVTNFENEYKQKNLSLAVNEKETVMMGDKDKISQVVVNLLSNALKYTQAGGHVQVEVEKRDSQVVLSVKDNGQGISKKDLPHIFERFYRADQSRNRSTGGAGIGLTIVKAIVDAHKGTIQVVSSPGQGTEFIVSFPG